MELCAKTTPHNRPRRFSTTTIYAADEIYRHVLKHAALKSFVCLLSERIYEPRAERAGAIRANSPGVPLSNAYRNSFEHNHACARRWLKKSNGIYAASVYARVVPTLLVAISRYVRLSALHNIIYTVVYKGLGFVCKTRAFEWCMNRSVGGINKKKRNKIEFCRNENVRGTHSLIKTIDETGIYIYQS